MSGVRRAPPAVSVLLPCRNAAPWLEECLASVFAQSLRDFEVIAVDDGSTDGTLSLLQSAARRDRRLRVLAGEGQGLVSALNRAASEAAAPLLARMDADDVAHPDRLLAQAEFLAGHTSLAACGAAVRLFPDSSLRSGYRRYEAWLNGLVNERDVSADLFVECPIAHPTLVVRQSVFHALAGYRELDWPEDYDLVLRLHAAGMRAANLPLRLLDWRVHPGRHSLRSERYAPRAFRRCKVHFLRTAFLPPGRPIVVWGAGKVGKPLALELQRQGSPVRAFVDLDPRKIGQEIHGAPVLAPEEVEDLMRDSDLYILAAVGSPGARGEIRGALDELGLMEIDDYRVCS
jgi:glycosyltransferase involved in cell wall biosynthesis